MKYQYLIEFETGVVGVAEEFSRDFNELIDRGHTNSNITHGHCWRRDGEEISQIPFVAQNSIDNTERDEISALIKKTLNDLDHGCGPHIRDFIEDLQKLSPIS